MIVVITLALILLIITAATVIIYIIGYYYPTSKREVPNILPESYQKYGLEKKMLQTINLINSTKFKEVCITSHDGFKLYGKLLDNYNDSPVVLMFHGYHGTSYWDGQGMFQLCQKNNWNILLVDERAHGKSESNTITFGIKERYDVKEWVKFINNHFEKEKIIILAGVSMGASNILMASSMNLPPNVKAIIADCSYTSPKSIIKKIIMDMKLPVMIMYPFSKLSALIIGHFKLEETSAIESVTQTNIPILFIHGEKDTFVPVQMCYELYKACKSKKKLAIIPDAGHATSFLVHYDLWENKVISFLNDLSII